MTPNSTDRLGPVSPLESLAAVHPTAGGVQSPSAFESILNQVSGKKKADPHQRPVATQRSKSPDESTKRQTRQAEESSSGQTETARSVARKQSAKTGNSAESRRAGDDQDRGADPAERNQEASAAASAPPPNGAPAESHENQHGPSGEAPESNPLSSSEGAGEGNSGTKQQASIALVDVLVDAVPQPTEEAEPQAEAESEAERDAGSDTTGDAAVEQEVEIATDVVVLPLGDIAAGSTSSTTTINSSSNESEARPDVDADSEGAPQSDSPIDALDAAQAHDSETEQADRQTQRPDEPSTSKTKERSQPENQVDAPLLPAVHQDQDPTPAQDTTAAQTQAQAQATSAPQPAREGPAASTGSSQTSNVQGPATRLPPHVMARSETRRSHAPAPVEIDSTRFLSRVARAFNAAQERGGEVRLRLSPPELGSLRLQVSVQDGVMVARMETETEAARASLVSNLPALRERLAEQGIRVERFDIDLMQQSSSGTPDRPNDPQQREEGTVHPFRPLVSPAVEAAVPATPGSSWNGQGRLNVII